MNARPLLLLGLAGAAGLLLVPSLRANARRSVESAADVIGVRALEPLEVLSSAGAAVVELRDFAVLKTVDAVVEAKEMIQNNLSFLKKLLTEHEGRVPYVYADVAGKPTIGVGHLITAAESQLLKHTKANPLPAAEIDRLLEKDIGIAASSIDSLGVPLTANQRAALVSFVFNFGWPQVKGSTLVAKLKARDYPGAAAEFGRWVYATDPKTKQKVQVAGLVKRRAAEKKLFETA